MPQSNCYREILNKKRFTLVFKRLFDIVASLFGLLILMIPFAVIAVLIKLTSRGPVFFRQVRVGRNGKEFRIYKFRTMVVDAEKKGLQITTKDDNRITKIRTTAGIIMDASKIYEPILFLILFFKFIFFTIGIKIVLEPHIMILEQKITSVCVF